MDADGNVTFSSLTDSFNLIAAVYESAIQSNLHYILRVRWVVLPSACPCLLIIQETWVTSLNQILHLESKRSRGGIQSYNSMKLLTESVPPLCLLLLWVTLQHATEYRFLYQTTDGSLEMFQSCWWCPRCSTTTWVSLLGNLRSVQGTVCANKSCACEEEGETAFRAGASVPGLQCYCHPLKFQLDWKPKQIFEFASKTVW